MGNQVEITYNGVSQGVITETQNIKLNTQNKYCAHDIGVNIELDGGAPTPPETPTDSVIFYSLQPFSFSVENHTKNWNGTLQWSTDGSTWTTYAPNPSSSVWSVNNVDAVQTGNWYKIYLKGENNNYLTDNASGPSEVTIRNSSNRRFVISNTNTELVICKGNIAKLLTSGTPSLRGCGFANLFRDNAYLDFDVILPQCSSYAGVFACMFEGCASMTKAPTLYLESANLGGFLYYRMFKGCSKLQSPPEMILPTQYSLPITINSYGCYQMFAECTALTILPTFVSEWACRLYSYGFGYMFQYCNNLTSIKIASSTQDIGSHGFDHMFFECMRLTTIEGLPNVAQGGYTFSYTFANCNHLTTIGNCTLVANVDASYTFQYMFQYCASLQRINNLTIQLASDNEATGNYLCRNMFQYCSNLRDASGLKLKNNITSQYCCYEMFSGCMSLTIAPTLPYITSTNTVASYCFGYMFYNCASLITAPELPATTMKQSCYANMFSGCTSLQDAPRLPATTLYNYCYDAMFQNCRSLEILPILPATTLAQYCYRNMFSGCTKIKLSTAQTGEYQLPYRIPATGTGTTASGALNNMFTSTGGTFTGTPTVNTTYYTPNDLGLEQLKYVAFRAPTSFTLSTPNNTSIWYPSTGTMEYSTDLGTTWSTWTGSALTANTNNLNTILLRGTDITKCGGDFTKYFIFNTNNIIVSGALEALLNYTWTADYMEPEKDAYCFYGLFSNGGIANAKNLDLRIIEPTPYCYAYLFQGCGNLTEAPRELYPYSLTTGCFEGMFQWCESLTTVPQIDAYELAPRCFAYMFSGCESLTISSLEAKGLSSMNWTLAPACCERMFEGCTGLDELPWLESTEIPGAQTIDGVSYNGAYNGMFANCTQIHFNCPSSLGDYSYSIPAYDQEGTAGTGALDNMFAGNPEEFYTPEINTTYWYYIESSGGGGDDPGEPVWD